jgi:elongation factor 2 kinase
MFRSNENSTLVSTKSFASNGIFRNDGTKPRLVSLLQRAATLAVKDDDPWSKYNIGKVPAERVIRHLYNPISQQWTTDETIVKIEREPFTHGAMRYCYRMKKRTQPPASATNHRFHRYGWEFASNYVAKAYIDPKTGLIDTSDTAKRAVQNDILLQYEAQHWAEKFNQTDARTKINFIRAYAIEFPDRDGQPLLAVERFISGKDSYGASFVKHNTNSGYVDTELRRVTPQVFSAYSFYASNGNRLVADIQGVGDLYTDPMVLSQDYRYGDGDLGPRGMALFFNTFRHCGMSDGIGIPIFALSKNELKVQAKYEEDEETLSHESDCDVSVDDDPSLGSNHSREILDAFQRLDMNRKRRASMLLLPNDLASAVERDTERRSNVTSRAQFSQSIRSSMVAICGTNTSSSTKGKIRSMHHRTASDIDEVQLCLSRAQSDLKFTNHDFHRKHSGQLKQRNFRDETKLHKSAIVRTVSAPMMINTELRLNLGRVHYQLAILHGMGRFPETVPSRLNHEKNDERQHDACHQEDKKSDLDVNHDVYSVLFHLSYAAALQNAPACLALGRVQSGLESSVSVLLHTIVPTDFEAAKILLRRAMMSSPSTHTGDNDLTSKVDPSSPKPKVAAGCLLFQILQDETHLAGKTSPILDNITIEVLEEILRLLDALEKENEEIKEHQKVVMRGNTTKLQRGDRVLADYALEGNYFPATVHAVDDCSITVCYDDDGSMESLPNDHVRLLVPPTATQTSLGGPLSDDEAFANIDGGDDSFIMKRYELLHDLAELNERAGKLDAASHLYEQAADGAMADGKMKTAAEWSCKAGEIRS